MSYGNTPVLRFAERDQIGVVESFLESGVDSNIQSDLEDDFGDTALMKATKNGNKKMIELLLSYDADPNIQDGVGNTALILSSGGIYSDIKNDIDITKLLLDSGANPNIQSDLDSTTPLILASISRSNRRIKQVKLLLDRGADPLQESDEGMNAYDYAIAEGNIEIAELLKHSMTVYRLQRRRRRNLTRKRLKTELANRNLEMSKMFETYEMDNPLMQEIRRETTRRFYN
jgi:ankyrin repeat protein